MPESLEETLAKLKGAPPIPTAPSTADFLVKEPEKILAPTGIENRVEEAKAFNAKLNAPNVPVVEGKTELSPPSKLQRIAQVLKDKGMDSQQQGQAMAQITEILGD